MNEHDILKQSPFKISKSIQWAYYSTGCCWWTSFAADVVEGDGGSLACPHCDALVLQMSLLAFLESSVFNAERGFYGKHGLDVFYASHERNVHTCHQVFSDYMID